MRRKRFTLAATVAVILGLYGVVIVVHILSKPINWVAVNARTGDYEITAGYMLLGRFRPEPSLAYQILKLNDSLFRVSLFLLLALAWGYLRALRERRAAARQKNGSCVTCGYDLTGNVSDICPECGTAVPAAKA